MGEQLELPFVPPLDPRISRRASVLRTAEEYITKDRASTHGNMEARGPSDGLRNARL